MAEQRALSCFLVVMCSRIQRPVTSFQFAGLDMSQASETTKVSLLTRESFREGSLIRWRLLCSTPLSAILRIGPRWQSLSTRYVTRSTDAYQPLSSCFLDTPLPPST